MTSASQGLAHNFSLTQLPLQVGGSARDLVLFNGNSQHISQDNFRKT